MGEGSSERPGAADTAGWWAAVRAIFLRLPGCGSMRHVTADTMCVVVASWVFGWRRDDGALS